MYIVSYASDFDGLTVGRQYVREELDDAIRVAVILVQRRGAEESAEDIRAELEENLDYISSNGDWGVFIGQPEAGEPTLPRKTRQKKKRD